MRRINSFIYAISLYPGVTVVPVIGDYGEAKVVGVRRTAVPVIGGCGELIPLDV
jgi:hypothetical protein